MIWLTIVSVFVLIQVSYSSIVPDVFPLDFCGELIVIQYASHHFPFRITFEIYILKVVQKNIWSDGNRRSNRYENWNDRMMETYDEMFCLLTVKSSHLEVFLTSWHGYISDSSFRHLIQCLRDISKRFDLQISETSPGRFISGFLRDAFSRIWDCNSWPSK